MAVYKYGDQTRLHLSSENFTDFSTNMQFIMISIKLVSDVFSIKLTVPQTSTSAMKKANPIQKQFLKSIIE